MQGGCALWMQCSVSVNYAPQCRVLSVPTVDKYAFAEECTVCIEGRNDLWLRTRSSHQGPVSLPWGTSKGQSEHGSKGRSFAAAIVSCLFDCIEHVSFQCYSGLGWARNLILNPRCADVPFLLFVISVMCCLTCDPWSSHILDYYGFLLHIIEHCHLSVQYVSLSQRAVGSWEWEPPNLKILCIVLFFRTRVRRKNCGFLGGKSSSSSVCPVRVSFVSSDRSSYSDSVLLLVRARALTFSDFEHFCQHI